MAKSFSQKLWDAACVEAWEKSEGRRSERYKMVHLRGFAAGWKAATKAAMRFQRLNKKYP